MKPTYVTQPHLPPLEEFLPYLKQIWDSKILTNCGPFHAKLEAALCQYLGVPHVSLFSNGMLALLTSLQALRVTGEVITTPYSFVATSHALHWNGLTPVYVDIDPATGNMDPKKIEQAITRNTTAIMPVHVYGNPCDDAAISLIAAIHGLKVIYDAAHTFGVKQNGRSILNYGDLAVVSFHATKVFNTFEGGAIICKDAQTKQRIDYLKNFGFADEVTVVAPGINAKMNEFQAALGLLQLQHLDGALRARAAIDVLYREALSGVKGLHCLPWLPDVEPNYSYFPVLIREDFPISRDALFTKFREANIYARRYFYPLISEFAAYRALPSASAENLPIASRMSQQVLCLPIYPALERAEQQRIVDVILAAAAI